MPGLFSRIKTWVVGETLTASDLNNEFDNIINNAVPDQIDDYSDNLGQMQTQTDPYPSGSESFATSLAGELERVRYSIAEVKGTTNWYEDAATSLEDLNTAISATNLLQDNRIVSGRTRTDSDQPLFLVPDGATDEVDLLATTTNLQLKINGSDITFSADVTLDNLPTPPTTNNTMLVNNGAYADGPETKIAGEGNDEFEFASTGSEIASLVGEYAAFKINDGINDEYFIGYIKSSVAGITKMTHCYRGYFFDQSDLPINRLAIANMDVCTLMQLAWIFARNDGSTLVFTKNNPSIQPTAPSSPDTNDYWFDTSDGEKTWKRFNGTIWEVDNSTLIGVTIQDENLNCVGARSFDFGNAFDDRNNIDVIEVDADTVRSTEQGNLVSVYGSFCDFKNQTIEWEMPADLESGQTEAANTRYYLYVTEECGKIISETPPYSRRDLQGYYHPHHTWRAVATVENDGSSDFENIVNYHEVKREFEGVDGSGTANVTLANTVVIRKNDSRPVLLGFNGNGGANSGFISSDSGGNATDCRGTLSVVRNNTTIAVIRFGHSFSTNGYSAGQSTTTAAYFPTGVFHVDFGLPPGEYEYELTYSKAAGDTISLNNVDFYAVVL